MDAASTTNNIVNTNTNTNINMNTNTNSTNNAILNMNTNTNTNNLPNSGIDGTQAYIIVPIIICIFASIVFFIKYRKIYE
ncbi:hypothetical protein D3C72_2339780 [compost metagenome]